MSESQEDKLLDNLLLVALESVESEKDSTQSQETKTKTLTKLNEDEYFLSKIAANDLKVVKQASTSGLKSKQTDKEIKSKFKNESAIHNGDTDSSDDEEKRDYQNRKYNDYGNDIKHLLHRNTETSDRESLNQVSSWKTKRAVLSTRPNSVAPVKEANEENILTDPFFGIRISKPLISSVTLKDRMSGRSAVSMARIKNFINQKQSDNWVIAGVIVEKSPVKTSQNGSNYIIFTLSDLKLELKSVSLFLFRNAYKELWKTAVGTVIGVLNPSILENRDGSKQEATLSVDNHQKVMIFGQSKDFGHCKSVRKDGKQCTSFVNTNNCAYCVYHVKQAYQQCSRRSELQAKFAGGGLTALRNKVLGKNEVFYAGKSYMAVPAKASKKLLDKDAKTLQALKKSGTITLPRCGKKPEPKTDRKGQATSLDISRSQRLKDLELLKKLNVGSTTASGLEQQKRTSMDESKTFALGVISKIKNAKQNKGCLPQENDPKPISSGITLEESKKAALGVISKLKSMKNKENSSRENDLEEKLDFDPKSISSGISLEESKKAALDVISKLKSMKNKRSSLTAHDVEEKVNFDAKSTSLDESKNAGLDVTSELKDMKDKANSSTKNDFEEKVEFDPKSVSANISLDESKKDGLGIISKLKSTAKNELVPKNTCFNITLDKPEKTTSNSTKTGEEIENNSSVNKFNSSLESEFPLENIENKMFDIKTTSSKANVQQKCIADKPELNPKSTSEITQENPDSEAQDNALNTKNTEIQDRWEETSDVNPKTSTVSLTKTKVAKEKRNIIERDVEEIFENITSTENDASNDITSTKSTVTLNNSSKILFDKLKSLDFVPKLSNPSASKLDIEIDSTENVEKKTSKTPGKRLNIKQNCTPKRKIDHSKPELLEKSPEGIAPSPSRAKSTTATHVNKPISNRSINVAKQNALKWVQRNGPISKNNPSGTKKSGVKRFLTETEDKAPKKFKLDKNAELSDRFKKIMALTSRHADLLDNYDLEQQEKYFEKLEVKEKMEEKMLSTFKVDCKAVKCLTCKYTSFSAADRCKQERHVLKVFNAVKRFFKCGDCGNRTVSLEIVPLFSCKNCNSSKWERTTMMKEKKVQIGETLSIRGGEQTFVNSHVVDANINLLVPED